jgi:hypothetical protein
VTLCNLFWNRIDYIMASKNQRERIEEEDPFKDAPPMTYFL